VLPVQGTADASPVPGKEKLHLPLRAQPEEDPLNTHEVAVLNGSIDVTWRAHQEHVFYEAEETLSGMIILTPRAEIPARRRKEPIPLRGQSEEVFDPRAYWENKYQEEGPW